MCMSHVMYVSGSMWECVSTWTQMACTTSGCGLCLTQQIKVQKEQALGDTKKELRNGTFIDVIIIILVEMRFRNLG